MPSKDFLRTVSAKIKAAADTGIIQLIIYKDDGCVAEIIEGQAGTTHSLSLLTRAGQARACVRDMFERNWEYRSNLEINALGEER
jgi:ribonuclease HI